ncbi:hypothetical protein L218DRAFT_408398 [Marasmius fiardii PR-910]|nr:hypothetical protein L218DRAFT_408398 [Marasmius fiardii PR-910]
MEGNQVVLGSTVEGFGAQLLAGDSIPPVVNTMPVEILAHIFQYSTLKEDFHPTKIPPLVHLTHVCSHWRMVALNSPFLWFTISLNNPTQRHIGMVSEWLERSKPCPLTLSLTVLKDSREAEEIMFSLLQHLHRWRSIHLGLMNFTIDSHSSLANLPVSREAAPLLEEVHITFSTI